MAVDGSGSQLDELAEVEQVEQLGQPVIRVVSVRSARRAAGDAFTARDLDPPPRTRLLVLQPTPFCNLDCDYCYLPNRSDRSRMELATVRLAARRLREDGLLRDELTVVWHAGEPLVLPPGWYDDAFAAIDEEVGVGVTVTHAIQTNATLIDASWCQFFRRHGVSVGVSVDGPAPVHDARRRTRAGAGTHAAVVAGMVALREHGVAFHAIAVVSAATLALTDADAFYDWFESQGVSELGCNVDEAEGANAACTLAGREALHAAFIDRLLQRSLAGKVVVREFAAAWQLLREPLPRWRWRGGTAWPDNTQAMPLALVTVGHDGGFSTFSPELLGQHGSAHGDFVLGNVHEGGVLQALQGEAFTRLWRDVRRGIAVCESRCAYFEHCGGGAPANKLYELGDIGGGETLHCRAMVQRPFDAVLREAERACGLPADAALRACA